tara:strand:+ start:1969 stop:2187 length:219 start_codon:yes stop_codon:yes gene_type:complete
MISKQKRNLINELSFWIIQEIDIINSGHSGYNTTLEQKTKIKVLINIVTSCRDYTNKQIKELINELKFQLPF